MYEENREKGLVVLAVSNEELESVEPYVESFALPFPVAAGSRTGGLLGQMVGQRGIPHSYLVDPEGDLVWHGHPSELTSGVLREALAGASAPGPKDALAWRGEVEGAPDEVLELAARGELAEALETLEESGATDGGAAALKEALDAHVADLRAQVQKAFDQRKVRTALTNLEVLVDEFERTDLGDELEEWLERMEDDESIQRELEAVELLDRALLIGRKRGEDKAKRHFERVVEKFPGTRAAERAQKILKGL